MNDNKFSWILKSALILTFPKFTHLPSIKLFGAMNILKGTQLLFSYCNILFEFLHCVPKFPFSINRFSQLIISKTSNSRSIYNTQISTRIITQMCQCRMRRNVSMWKSISTEYCILIAQEIIYTLRSNLNVLFRAIKYTLALLRVQRTINMSILR
jgi:hypothetical protein